MELLISQAQDIIQIVYNNGLIIGVAVFIVGFFGTAAYVIASAPLRINRRVAEATRDIDIMTQQWNEAEKVGQIGSFVFDFENPSASTWSEEAYVLCGLVPRKVPLPPSALIEYAHKDDLADAAEAWTRAQTQPGAFDFVFRSVAPTKQVRSLHVKGTTSLDANKSPRLILGVVQDITREIEVNRSKSEFVSLASHQLKSPLTALRWFAEALLNNSAGELTKTQREYINNMYATSTQMMRMVNDLLNVSRIELHVLAVEPVDIDTRALATNVIEEQRHEADAKKLTLQFSSAPDVPHLFADEHLIRMVLQNLISNAIKYTPESGTVECELSNSPVHGSVFLRVSDTGIGIPKAEQNRVFERLHRASNAEVYIPDGTGLGLYVVKMIIDRVGGAITFESKEGKGTTFSVTIPITWQPSQPSTHTTSANAADHATLSV